MAFGERLVAFADNGSVVGKDIFAGFVLVKAVALLVVEPFDGTDSFLVTHGVTSYFVECLYSLAQRLPSVGELSQEIF